MEEKKWIETALAAITETVIQAVRQGAVEIRIRQNVWFLPFEEQPVIFTDSVATDGSSKAASGAKGERTLRVEGDLTVLDLSFQGSRAAFSQALGGRGGVPSMKREECFQ